MNYLLVIALIVLMHGASADAQTVYRCLDSNGERVFSDRPCRHFGMNSVDPVPNASAQEFSGNALDAEAERGPVPAANGCLGATPEALRDSVLTAILSRDLNALTGMYYWAGAGRHSANSVIDLMKRLIAAKPKIVEVRAVEVTDDWLWAGLPPPTEPPMPELVVLLDAGALDPIARFRLHSQAGCVWLSQQ